MTLLDTHMHLILRDALGYGWTQGLAALEGRSFTLDDYAALTKDKGIISALFMESGVDDADYQNETRLVATLIDKGALEGRLIGQIASCRPEHEAGFAAWLDTCKDLHVVGFRRILHVVDDGLSQTDTFRANLQKIGQAGYCFDLCVRANQLPLALALIDACPNQTFVLDHCGNPDFVPEHFDQWSHALANIAKRKNVTLKLSGISANAPKHLANLGGMKPYVDVVLRHFGPARMLWGGDWPVVDLGVGLPAWIDMTRALLADLSADEQAAIGHMNARRIYGLKEQT